MWIIQFKLPSGVAISEGEPVPLLYLGYQARFNMIKQTGALIKNEPLTNQEVFSRSSLSGYRIMFRYNRLSIYNNMCKIMRGTNG